MLCVLLLMRVVFEASLKWNSWTPGSVCWAQVSAGFWQPFPRSRYSPHTFPADMQMQNLTPKMLNQRRLTRGIQPFKKDLIESRLHVGFHIHAWHPQYRRSKISLQQDRCGFSASKTLICVLASGRQSEWHRSRTNTSLIKKVPSLGDNPDVNFSVQMYSHSPSPNIQSIAWSRPFSHSACGSHSKRDAPLLQQGALSYDGRAKAL